MSSVIITGPNGVQEAVINELHNLKILHIVGHSKNEYADIGNPLENAGKLSEILVKVRALISALSIVKEESSFNVKKGLLEIDSATKKLNQEVAANSEELKKTDELISKNDAVRQELGILKDIDVPLESFSPYKSLAYFTGYVKDEISRLSISVELSKTTKNFIEFHSAVKNKSFIVFFVDIKHKEQASSILQKNGFSPVIFSNIANLKGNASINLKRTEEERTKLEKRNNEIKKGLDSLAQEYKEFLTAADGFLNEQLEKSEAPLKFASTKSSFLIKGWVPAEQLNSSIERLNKAAKNRIFVHFQPPKKSDKVPVKLKNPKFAKPFEFFMDLYTMPNYREIDPTFFMFLTFPLLFGFMLGDIGYGLATLILFIALKKLMPKAKSFFNILIFASLATILFGLMFGEFFGYEEIADFHIPHVLSRSHQITELLYLAVAVGVFHINLGIIIGFFNELKSHGIMAAVYAKGGWFVLEAGIALLVLSIIKLADIPIYAGVGFLALSIFMLFKGEGIRGLIEIPGIFSNTLSYARLMAIGLSSVKLAEVINESAGEMFHSGGFFMLAGILVLAVGHIINIGLGLLGSFLHSLRLHYVEFFTKFFHGGAEKYMPFGAKDE